MMNKWIIGMNTLPYILASRVFLYLSPMEQLNVRPVSKSFCVVVSAAWKSNLAQLNKIAKDYESQLHGYGYKEVEACRIRYTAYIKLKSQINKSNSTTLSHKTFTSNEKHKNLIICLGLLLGIKESEIHLSNAIEYEDTIQIIDIIKKEFDPLEMFMNEEVKKGKKKLRGISGDEPIFRYNNDVEKIYTISCLIANAHRIAKKFFNMTMSKLVELEYKVNTSFKALNIIYTRIGKYKY